MRTTIPVAAGSVMALIMLAMLHPRLMSGEPVALPAVLAFLGGHLALLGLIAAIALFLPGARRMLRLHRPSRGHIALMLTGAVATALATHALLHGGAA